MMEFDSILTAVSLGLSLTSCISTAILWAGMIRRFGMFHILSSEQDDDGEYWIIGLSGRVS
jgi:hypothetical protein